MLVIGIVGVFFSVVGFLPAGIDYGLFPEPRPPFPITYIAALIVTGLLAATSSGWLTARISAQRPLVHVGALVTGYISLWIVPEFTKPTGPDYILLWQSGSIGSMAVGTVGMLAGGWLEAARRSPNA
jgi:hypothetical protein